MELSHALHILRALADGIDPMTGEVLPADNSCNHPDTVRALFTAIKALELIEPRQQKEQSLLANAGKAWTQVEDKQLCESFDKGIPIKELAQQHGRTLGAMRSRLERLDKLSFVPPKQ